MTLIRASTKYDKEGLRPRTPKKETYPPVEGYNIAIRSTHGRSFIKGKNSILRFASLYQAREVGANQVMTRYEIDQPVAKRKVIEPWPTYQQT